MYNAKIMEIFNNPSNVGIMRGADAVGECKNSENGEIIKIYVDVEDNVIKQAKFKAFGNALLIASGSIITELIKDKKIEELNNITANDILNELGEIPLTKMYCATMCETALKNIVTDYIKRQEKLLKQISKK